MNPIQELLITELKKAAINPDEETGAKLFDFIDRLLEGNQTTNLTAITDYQEALFKHIYDALMIVKRPEYFQAERILDIGSGAGIPGIPLAICTPDKRIISLDSVQKKIKFQAQTCRALNILNVRPVWARAEDFIKDGEQREQFDLVLARAVAPLNVLVELTVPFLKLQGYALLYKGRDYQQELQAAQKAITIVGGRVSETITTELPLNYGTRTLIVIQKVQLTPGKYPRKAGVPQKNPL
ncbi:MAG TPA: 16S rRNA (guanine(527)-N(7))-methyltransferase RsmG [Firmicutes bacterium]|jgi:16S rRNA (guanine527-N7)-methyltransferase|nr:16S rRNA (guanine(527)-N(7))-methyltransferase RsmG [Bacillota bacterium]